MEKVSKIRITDLGAVTAIHMTTDALLHIFLNENVHKIKTIDELKDKLREDLKKYIIWIEKRERDGTLLGRYTRKELNGLIKTTKEIMSWGDVPKKKIESIKNEKESLFSLEKAVDPTIKKVKVLMDTSFLLSYILKDKNFLATEVLIGYLKPQQRYFDLYIPNFVFFELVSKLKKYNKFSKVKKLIDNLFEEINPKNIHIGGINLDMLEVYDRYKLFSRKKISSMLKGNDFMIATEGIMNNALILTCDKQFYKNCSKIYKETYLIMSGKASDISKFVNKFEKVKEIMIN